jgi:mRNA-degrading endonuclease toxin of MazEF toxin-antitoxin module
LFGESFTLKLLPKFVENENAKEHGFKNHVNGFIDSLQQNSVVVEKQRYVKWHIYVVNYGMNTGSEINGNRPSIIYKASHSTYGDDVVVIPLTSIGKQSQGDTYDILVTKDNENKLYQSSYARLRQIRSVSVKRIGKKLGELNSDLTRKLINDGITKMLGVDV